MYYIYTYMYIYIYVYVCIDSHGQCDMAQRPSTHLKYHEICVHPNVTTPYNTCQLGSVTDIKVSTNSI